jgi:D-alanyl-lipoteichoic acid acyltransferase DltB (MBOAT superfamily)
VALVLASVIANAGFGTVLCSGRLSPFARKATLIAGLAFNLGVLAYFKYAIFIVENLNDWFGAGITVPKIILPIGISFITFQKIAFLVDAYQGKVRHFTFWNFALFVTFFPQLIAGPITHHGEIMPQFAENPAKRDFKADLAIGLSIFCVGLFKKVIIADTCAVFADAGYGTLKAGGTLGFASAWITVFAYSFQLYYDFSGYSDMAIGLARMFGIRFPVNFHSPYKATGIIDFWRRWHITLSRFLRDYLYIPLGGNRHGGFRRYLNLAIVMLLGGLWHGANWTFVVWGGVHGALLGINHAWNRLRVSRGRAFNSAFARRFSILLTFMVVTLAWVPFRADNLGQAGSMLKALFPVGSDGNVLKSLSLFFRTQFINARHSLDLMSWFKPRELWPAPLPPDFLAEYRPAGLVLLCVAIATFTLPNTQQIFARFDPIIGMPRDQLYHRRSVIELDTKVALVLSGLFVFCVLSLSRVSPFLYFQF